jgi:hypothetical protein
MDNFLNWFQLSNVDETCSPHVSVLNLQKTQLNETPFKLQTHPFVKKTRKFKLRSLIVNEGIWINFLNWFQLSNVDETCSSHVSVSFNLEVSVFRCNMIDNARTFFTHIIGKRLKYVTIDKAETSGEFLRTCNKIWTL